MMYLIAQDEISDGFADCWRATGRHLALKLPHRHPYWLKMDLSGPFLEHISIWCCSQPFEVIQMFEVIE